ncbi:hypothetical protein Pmani_029489 [Petrolisthes manimaculis]|uniref:Uncharacterized protein n=1 Tax=Petrolisthes manimaculis TaxID=1843537 RepID=A0AAE1NZ96_9EUCA|nr:hypothetical protein Pmani_029489 [Petrolisthes manimaculis]
MSPPVTSFLSRSSLTTSLSLHLLFLPFSQFSLTSLLTNFVSPPLLFLPFSTVLPLLSQLISHHQLCLSLPPHPTFLYTSACLFSPNISLLTSSLSTPLPLLSQHLSPHLLFLYTSACASSLTSTSSQRDY